MTNDKKRNITEEDMRECVKTVTTALVDQRASDVEVLHVSKFTTMADYFIICTGSSVTHIRALSEAAERSMEETHGIRPHHIEGYGTASWVLVDFGFMVVHIFHRDTRQFYSLERLWSDAPVSNISSGQENG